MQGIGWRFC